MIRPKVSICIPTYMQIIYLQKTLDSILKQDYTNFELVVTDDSPDESVKNLLDKYDFKGK
ncbi:MAG TPA: glycosyltransferase, partial [Bacteroidia bacterium]|nr:glycosyltransferase [Bacteroidia bacterium]